MSSQQSLNKNPPSILNDDCKSAPPTQEEYDCPPDSWEDVGCSPPSPETEIISAPSGSPSTLDDSDDSLYAQLEGSLDSSTSHAPSCLTLDENDTSDLVLDRELKQAGAEWQAYTTGERTESPSRNRFNLYSTPCIRKKNVPMSAAQKEKNDNELLHLLLQ